MGSFLISTLCADRENLCADNRSLTDAQIATGVIELAAIVGGLVLAALVLFNNHQILSLPHLNSLNNLTAFIIIGSGGGLFVVNSIVLAVHQHLTNKMAIEELSKSVEELEKKYVELEKEYSDLQKNYRLAQQESTSIQTLSIINAQAIINAQDLVQNSKGQIDKLKNQLTSVEEENKKLKGNSDLASATGKITELEGKLASLEKTHKQQLDQLTNELEKNKRAVKVTTDAMSAITQKKKEGEEQITKLQNELEVARQTTEKTLELLDKKNEEINKNVDKKEDLNLIGLQVSLENEISRLKGEKTTLIEAMDEYEKSIEKYKKELEALKYKSEEITERYNEREQALNALNEKCEEVKQKLQDLQKEEKAHEGRSPGDHNGNGAGNGAKPNAPAVPTGGPPPPPPMPKKPKNGSPPQPPPMPNATNGNGVPSNGNKEPAKKSAAPQPIGPEDLNKRRLAIAANNNVPKMDEKTQEALDQIMNGKTNEDRESRDIFFKALDNVKKYLQSKKFAEGALEILNKQDIDLEEYNSLSPILAPLAALPHSLRKYILELRAFIYKGQSAADKKARAKACERVIDDEIIMTTKEGADDKAENILARALGNMRVAHENHDESDSEEWSD